jgi:hypothetical protein
VSEQPKEVDRAAEQDEHTFTEQIEIAASDLVDRTKELIEEGNVRRIIIRNQDDEVLMEVPLTAGVVVGGVSLALSCALVRVIATNLGSARRWRVDRGKGRRFTGPPRAGKARADSADGLRGQGTLAARRMRASTTA